MAYIDAAQTRAIKKNLSKAFPDYKFSVRNEHHSSVLVQIVSGPKTFYALSDTVRNGHCSINHYCLDNFENADILKKMYAIINDGNYDNSDIMTDYFDVGFYVNMAMGNWNKPYEVTA